ncbi:uncharacterized protein LOC142627391 [Castanea sativa]|uniref:uncharacterized protein LOC142627391 n=1 Tax=Castanea sativa TaxID=21020 RepID=UPI003F64C861
MSVEVKTDGKPWYHDIKAYVKNSEYLSSAPNSEKKFIRHMAYQFFLNEEVLCRLNHDSTLLRCIDASEANHLMEEMHEGLLGAHASGPLLAHKIMRAGYYWLTMEMEATDKNIKKILVKMIDTYKDWHEYLPFALCAYRTSIRTSTGATPYSLVYGMEAVLPIEVEISSLKILSQIELSEAEWAHSRYVKLNMIDSKCKTTMCHGQLYQCRIEQAFNKKLDPGSSKKAI